MAGGTGDDIYAVDSSFDVVSESPGEGTDTVNAGASYGLSVNIENLNLVGVGNINGTGNTLVNTINGNAGNNIINGGGGADFMNGGAGDDSYVVDSSFDTISEGSGQGTDRVFASVDFGLSACENPLQGLNINGFGNAFANLLIGNGGNNVLDGAAMPIPDRRGR